MPRALKIDTFDLNADTMAAPINRQLAHRHVYVADMPAGTAGLITIGLDGSDGIPAYPGLRLTACTGAIFTAIAVRAPAVGGTLTLLYANDDAVPFSSGGGGAGGTLAPAIEAQWLPHEGAQAGVSVLSTAWYARGGILNNTVPYWSEFQAGLGLAARMDIKAGKRVATLRPNGGTAGLRLFILEYPWSRARTQGRSVTGRPDRSRRRCVTTVTLCKEAAGGAKGLGSGVFWCPSNSTLAGSPSGNNPFVGFTQQAGAWYFAARAAGGAALQEAVAVTWPTAETNLVRLTIELLDADAQLGRDGEVRGYVNDALVARFTTPANLPTLAGDQTGYQLLVMDEGAAAEQLSISDAVVRIGALEMAA